MIEAGARKSQRRIGFPGAMVALLVVGLGACDFEVSNPGPVDDDALYDPGAHAGLVEGAEFGVSEALWETSYHGTEVAKEITRAGRNFCCPKVPSRVGEMNRDAVSGSVWNVSHRARFMADDAVRRFEASAEENEDLEFESYELAARAKLAGGYAYRVLGENMCTAVFDGSEPQDNQAYWERAEERFTRAIEIGENAGAQDVVTAARAGRAQVRGPGLGDWSGAASDAEQVPEDFVHVARYSTASDNQWNNLYDLARGEPFVDWTVWDSDIETYYDETGDSRVPYVDRGHSDTPLGIPLYEQQKFTSLSDPINLASGREMLLLRAEAYLEAGQWEPAMALINDVRTTVDSDHDGEPLEELEAGSLEEAWTHLKDERRWELWMESRRMGDLRRWIDDDTPGEMEDMSGRERLCFPVTESEIDHNENLEQDWEDPFNPIYTGS